MDIQELLSINSNLKRRLVNNIEDSNPALHDALGRKVNAHFIAADSLRVFLPNFGDFSSASKPYIFGIDGRKFIGEDEARIILGHDYFTQADKWDVPAMLKACEGGYGGARTNAYCLGPTHSSGKDCAEIPVAYFIIPKREHQRLIVNPTDKRFQETLESLRKVA